MPHHLGADGKDVAESPEGLLITNTTLDGVSTAGPLTRVDLLVLHDDGLNGHPQSVSIWLPPPIDNVSCIFPWEH